MTDLTEARELRDELQKSLDTLRRMNIASSFSYTSKTVLVLTSLIECVEELEVALKETKAIIAGECPSLLREYTAGQPLEMLIDKALKEGEKNAD